MIVNDTYEIDSCDDVELGIKRESKLEFKLCFDDEKTPEALVFVIPGLGGDANENYRDHLAEFIAKEFNVAFVSVNYHCIGNRPQTGSSFYLDDIDKLILKTSCETIDIGIDLNKLNTLDGVSSTLREVDKILEERKNQGIVDSDFILSLHVSLQPKKNEYQNFGIMQAQDLLNVALYLKKYAPFDTKQGNIPVIMIGSSHGGYLVHLAAKIAPWIIDGVVDNSSYAKFPWRLVGFGKEIDFTRYYCFGTGIFFKHIHIYCSDKTFWTSNASSPYFFSPARRKIRHVLEPSHLEIQAKYQNPYYVSYHSYYDKSIAPFNEKNELYKCLKKLQFDVKLHVIKEAKQVDGKFIKNLDHGMEMSIKTLIAKELSLMLEKIKQKMKIEYKEKRVAYPCENLIYQFSEENDKISLRIDTL
ncbi:DUF2920 family protein [Campylobacter hepaticus]|uniref:DUF2920 family protein n=1 Tax=Campylobacter hepaticus TaxID=1813019 RepID=UPI0018C08BF7|nr:DUF2920 family protein [Campylobacter hepaticus]MDX2330807.1 DUF2920 family protein [Campylobacter hepaticus]MDX2371422.1 DUF2920 family protein [Campylobacter hepaticus]MDX2396672.1 DUF2920 family protein [Campylobacter hepaticus]MDX5508580.1 DUF2920 family protein [Campylobacter hepaticus]QOW63526.1 DUF2920 family protein [Campylobacter hepaticus]